MFVEGLNIVKRHKRPQQVRDAQRAEQVGGVIEKEGPIHVSNVMLVDPKEDKPTRVGVVRERRRAPPRGPALGQQDRLNAQHGPTQGALRDRDAPRADQALRATRPRCRRPGCTKMTLNMGVGEAKQDSNMLEAATEQLATIAGQKPNVRRARKSIAAFKLREGMPVGVSVTLRRERTYEFLDRLMSIAIPRIRDFRGLSPALLRRPRELLDRASASRSSSPRSTTTRSTRSAGWTSPSPRAADSDEEGFALLEAFGHALLARGPARALPSDGRRGGGGGAQRKEEARARAEAEQAALEQLKEENPEAYAKPEPEPEEGEEGDDGEARGTGRRRDLQRKRRHE